MKSKEILIQKIKTWFFKNGIEEAIDLKALNRVFELYIGGEEGYIDVIHVSEFGFVYTPSGHLDEIDGDYNSISNKALKEIIEILNKIR